MAAAVSVARGQAIGSKGPGKGRASYGLSVCLLQSPVTALADGLARVGHEQWALQRSWKGEAMAWPATGRLSETLTVA